MTDYKNREIHLTSRPDGLPVPENFSLIENNVSSDDGDVLVKNVYMSVDPAMRPPLTNGQTKLDEPMMGG
ncbi:MAG: NADP-dependent oxidoreductase, partial [Pseudomonadales bacterium]|nr:NADP-dependent oxidoreductase [Pseudomonadales bacterium]